MSIRMSPVIMDVERTPLAASFQNRRLFTRNNRTFGRWGGYFFWVIASKYPVATTSNTIASNSVILTHPLSGERSRHKSGDVPHLLYGTSRSKVKHIIESPVRSTHFKQDFHFIRAAIVFRLSMCMSPVIMDIERTSLTASFHNRLLFYQ